MARFYDDERSPFRDFMGMDFFVYSLFEIDRNENKSVYVKGLNGDNVMKEYVVSKIGVRKFEIVSFDYDNEDSEETITKVKYIRNITDLFKNVQFKIIRIHNTDNGESQVKYIEGVLNIPIVNDFTPARIIYSGTCPICLNEETEGGFCALECGHVFHCACIQTYANTASQSGIVGNKVCPVCRGPLNRMVRVDPPFEFGRKYRLRKRQVG